MSHESIAVIVPTYLRPQFLQNCVESIFNGTRLPDKLFLSCRNTDSDTLEVAELLKAKYNNKAEIAIVLIDEPGHIPPIQGALNFIHEDITVILDDDTTVYADWLEQLLRPMESPTVACVGGHVATPFFPTPKIKGRPGRISFFGRLDGNLGWLESDRELEVDTVMEGNSAWRTALLKSIQIEPLFKEDESPYYGLFLTLSLKKRGYKIVFNSSARIDHYIAPRDSSISRNNSRYFVSHRNYMYIVFRFMPWYTTLMFIFWSFLVGDRTFIGAASGLYMLATGSKIVKERGKFSLKGRIAGIRLFYKSLFSS